MSVARERLVVLHRFVDAAVSSVGEREFRGNAGSPDLQTDGFELDLLGGDLSRLQGGPLLWTHGEDGGDPLIGTVTRMTATAQELPFTAEFLPAGVDPLADDLCRKLKAGAPYGMSLGFTIEEYERLPGGAGMRALKWSALELSLCAVPVDSKAVITARARGPLAALSAAEQWEHERLRRMQAWRFIHARQEEERRRCSYAQRQADLRALSPESTH